VNKPNTNFELSISDLELIERSLHSFMNSADYPDQKEISKVLGKLHNQKNWYRPKTPTYVSG
jgi:hypothetical protein